ncbi:MAG: DedA family protein [Hyphomicrobium zavarzinii]|uniref:YqaA family protein n=1 Tax=Hyphomicrobium TaxID=81 RepID=UPI00047EC4D2|nr:MULTISPECIES: YqaA family protein [Hyphomicrobium]MBL8847920.1 DedA family protein [Hyphomicrobium zavarzinii]WBT39099.1 DedA family protein [Hyphomicrobium sp. DMF-1]HML43862.1 YqaA family protein [Hyphomicrobium zavarzinii]
MMRRLYDWMMAKARNDRAPHALFWVSFIESSFFPIPPDVMLIPMVIAQRAKAWWYATVATIGSVIGGAFGYGIGYFFFEQIGRPILEFYGKAQSFGEFTNWFNEWGVWILIIKGMTPFPYKVLTITAGVTHMPLIEFMLASVIARAMRFYLVAGLLYFFGEPIREFIEKRLTLVTTVFVVLLVLGFVAIKYVF